MGRRIGNPFREKVSTKEFGKRLKECRLAKGLSIQKMTDDIGISRSHYSQLESGDKVPSLETLIYIIQYLGITSDDLLRDYSCKRSEIRGNLLIEKLEQLSESDQEHIEKMVLDEINYILGKRND